ncbi:hypothetical protein VCHENC02_4434A, partial [Vibrio harveyi]
MCVDNNEAFWLWFLFHFNSHFTTFDNY